MEKKLLNELLETNRALRDEVKALRAEVRDIRLDIPRKPRNVSIAVRRGVPCL
jgi:hypothetical protein